MTSETPSSSPHRPSPEPVSHARIGLALLAYLLGVTLIITLLPFQFDRPTEWRIMLTGTPVDVAANVLLFVPLGFLFRLASVHHGKHAAMRVLGGGMLLSMAIECAQLFEIERYSSPIDVVTNAFGAWLGAVACDRASRHVSFDHAVVGRLSLELPLMGLVYLTVPLLWLNALASGPDVEHAGLSLLIAAFGAAIVGGLQRHHFRPVHGVGAARVSATFVVWFLAGTFPLLPTRPAWVLTGATVGALLVWRKGRATSNQEQRRYEIPVLRSAVPSYGTFLLLLAATPLIGGVGLWEMGIGFPGVATEWTKIEILRLLELVAAFTLAGYMVAEYRGRVDTTLLASLGRVTLASVVAALLTEFVRGFHAGHGASLSRGVLLISAGAYGGWLYNLQREHIMRLLAASRPASPPSESARPDEAAA
jgi:glycopeptide antibiotics resistance protein